MGRQSRLRAQRRAERGDVQQPSAGREPLRILRSIHKTIQHHCHESPRRCWEYMLEMLAHSSGWDTESHESQHLWEPMHKHGEMMAEFLMAWHAEIQDARKNRTPFSEPIGQLLLEVEAHNEALAQYFTPMEVVRALNEITLSEGYSPPDEWGYPSRRGLDPCCGTGRMMIDALVHDDGILMHGVDLDLWMLRAAMLNIRLLAPWTSCHLVDPTEPAKGGLQAFTSKSAQEFGVEQSDKERSRILFIGGRAIFIHGDALIVDLNYTPNWACAGWAWKPQPWQSNLKIAERFGFFGTWEQFQAGDAPTSITSQERVQFDFEMKDPHGP